MSNDHFLHLIHRVSQAADEVFLTHCGGIPVTARQAAVLDAIDKLDAPSQTQLVDMTGIDRSTMADIVRRLTKNGLVARKRTKDDARRYAVKLTEQGEKAVLEARAALEKAEGDLLNLVSPKSRTAFVAGLRSIVQQPLAAAE